MVIAHVLSSFGQGGQERLAVDLARLQRIARHEVLAVSIASGPPGPISGAFRTAGVSTKTIAKGPRVDPSLPLRLAAFLWHRRVDIVHTHNPHALIYGAPAGRLAGASVIYSKHGMNPAAPRRLWLRQAAAKLVDAYVAVTPALARQAIDQGDCDDARLHVISSGIDCLRFAPNGDRRRQVRAELGIADDAWVVGTVGRLAPEKDHALLVAAMAPLLCADRRLVVVGDGVERNALRALVDGIPGRRWVQLLGERRDVESLLAAFDAFVLTSRTEGLPLVLLEAMATGLPVLSTAVGGIPDLVEDGVTGLLVPPGERARLTGRLATLSTDEALSRRLGEAGRRQVRERYSIDRTALEYGALYERTLRSRSETAGFSSRRPRPWRLS